MALFGKLFGKTLYYPGCSSKFVNKDIQRRHEHLLTSFDIEYLKLPELEVCCGLPALQLGYKEDFNRLIKKNNDMFKNQKIKTIITSCPTCYYVFKKYYNIEVKYILEVFLENMESIKKHYSSEKITFFDPCNFIGDEMLYTAPREILKQVGFELVEMERNRENSMCCGSPLKENSPKIAETMANTILGNIKTEKVITTCPSCYAHLKNNSNIEVMELSEVLV